FLTPLSSPRPWNGPRYAAASPAAAGLSATGRQQRGWSEITNRTRQKKGLKPPFFAGQPCFCLGGDRRPALLGQPLHIVEQIMQRLVGDIGHFCERPQKAVSARQLKERLVAILALGRADQNHIVVWLEHQLRESIAGAGYIFDDAISLGAARLLHDRHSIGGPRRRRFDQGAREGAQKSLVEPENCRRALVGDGRAHLESGPERGASAKVIGRGEIEIDRVDRHWRRHGSRRQKGETSRLPLQRNIRRR